MTTGAGTSASAQTDTQGQNGQGETIEQRVQRLDQENRKLKNDNRSLLGRVRVAQVNSEAAEESEKRLTETMQRVLKKSLATDDPEERDRIFTDEFGRADRLREKASHTTQSQTRLQKVVDNFNEWRRENGIDGEVDFDDPMFEEAKSEWEAGNSSAAIASARNATLETRLENMRSAGQYSRDDLEQERERAARNATRDGARVDTAGSTSSPSTGPLAKARTVDEARRIARENRDSVTAGDLVSRIAEISGRSIKR